MRRLVLFSLCPIALLLAGAIGSHQPSPAPDPEYWVIRSHLVIQGEEDQMDVLVIRFYATGGQDIRVIPTRHEHYFAGQYAGSVALPSDYGTWQRVPVVDRARNRKFIDELRERGTSWRPGSRSWCTARRYRAA